MIKWNPVDYNNNSSQLEKWAKDLISGLSLNGDERILDIGSGDGKVTAEIARLLPEGSVVGIDSSAEMISFAGGKFDKKAFPNLEFRLMDMRDIGYDGEFDVVFSTATLHWVTDHRQVLAQIKKSLRSPGKLYLQMGGRGNQEDLIKTLSEVKKGEKWRRYFEGFDFQYGYYGIEDYKGWLKETGLAEKRIELINKDNALNGKDGLQNWIRLAFSPYVQRLPEIDRLDFINDIACAYLEKYPPDEDGLCHLKMIRLEVEACV